MYLFFFCIPQGQFGIIAGLLPNHQIVWWHKTLVTCVTVTVYQIDFCSYQIPWVSGLDFMKLIDKVLLWKFLVRLSDRTYMDVCMCMQITKLWLTLNLKPCLRMLSLTAFKICVLFPLRPNTPSNGNIFKWR